MGEKSEEDSFFMQRCFELALQGYPSPNPYVGAVLVKDDESIGEGFHLKAGGNHAEIEAILDVKEKHPGNWEELILGSTLYVNLEPCNHTGRTPPCSEAILKAGISRVVYAMNDPHKIAGGGAQKLKENGVEVVPSVLEGQAKAINAAYLKVLETGLPLVTLKMACTMDGKTATATGDSKWISSEESRAVVMKMRDKADAVIIGANTALFDNPKLTARGNEKYRNPLRVVVAGSLRVKRNMEVFGDKNVLVAYCDADEKLIESFRAEKIELLKCPKTSEGRVDLRFLLLELAKRGKNQVLCEGGATLSKSLLDLGLIDVMIIFYSPKILGGEGRGIFEGAGASLISECKKCEIVNAMMVGGDLMVVAKIGG